MVNPSKRLLLDVLLLRPCCKAIAPVHQAKVTSAAARNATAPRSIPFSRLKLSGSVFFYGNKKRRESKNKKAGEGGSRTLNVYFLASVL